MANFAGINLIGHTGKDSQLTYTQKGTAVAKCSMAVKTGYGEREVTTWWMLTVWGKQAELFNEWVRKGMLIHVSGEPSLNTWIDQEGNERQSLDVNVRSFETLERRDASNQSQSNDQPF